MLFHLYNFAINQMPSQWAMHLRPVEYHLRKRGPGMSKENCLPKAMVDVTVSGWAVLTAGLRGSSLSVHLVSNLNSACVSACGLSPGSARRGSLVLLLPSVRSCCPNPQLTASFLACTVKGPHLLGPVPALTDFRTTRATQP